MLNVYQNPYLEARLFAKMTRQQAAMLLPCSESSIKDYETDVRDVPDTIVVEMAKIYRTPWLRVQHLKRNLVFCDIFGIVPDSVNNQERNILLMQKEVGDVVKIMPTIIDNALLHLVDSRAIKECREAMNALLLIVGSSREKENPSMLTHQGVWSKN